jgi:ribosomal protein L15
VLVFVISSEKVPDTTSSSTTGNTTTTVNDEGGVSSYLPPAAVEGVKKNSRVLKIVLGLLLFACVLRLVQVEFFIIPRQVSKIKELKDIFEEDQEALLKTMEEEESVFKKINEFLPLINEGKFNERHFNKMWRNASDKTKEKIRSLLSEADPLSKDINEIARARTAALKLNKLVTGAYASQIAHEAQVDVVLESVSYSPNDLK